MKVLGISVLFLCSSISASLLLQHNSTSSICPGSVVSCECSGADLSLGWVVRVDGREVWQRIDYFSEDMPGPESIISRMLSSSGEPLIGESILLSVDRTVIPPVLASILNITLGHQDVRVACEGNFDINTTIIHVTSKYNSYN